MKIHVPAFLVIIAISSCGEKAEPRSAALPDNVVSDKPIVLKEGQAVVFMKDGDRDLMVAASVIDGKLSVSEVDPHGRNFGVTWKDSETWQTSTMDSEGENSTTVLDKDGDGYADFRAEMTPSGLRRFELQGDTWNELETNKANKAEMATPRKPSD